MGRAVVDVCKYGHVIAEVGRYRSDRDKYGPCKACNLIAARESKKRRVAQIATIKAEQGCSRCGYHYCSEALHFHHRDPTTKLFSLGSGPARSWAVVQAEIAKCDVLCANCHIELHKDERDATHD